MKNLQLLFIVFLLLLISKLAYSTKNFNRDSLYLKTQQILDKSPDSCSIFINSNSKLFKENELNYFEGIIHSKNKFYIKSNLLLFKSIHNNIDYSNINYSDIYYYLALNYYHLGIIDSAIYFFKEEVNVEKNMGYHNKTKGAYCNIGVAYRLNGQIDSAIHYNNLAMLEYQQAQDTSGLAKIENNLGNLYSNFNNKVAIKHYSTALNYYLSLNNTKYIAITKHNLGVLFVKSDKYKLGLEYLTASYSYFEDNNSTYYQIITLNNMGFANLNLKHYDLATEYFIDAIRINDQYKAPLTFSYLNLGELNNIKKKYTRANQYLLKALQISKENKIDYLLDKIYQNLVIVAGMNNNKLNFLKYFNTYKKILKKNQEKSSEEALAKYQNEMEIIQTKHLLKLASKDKKIRLQEIENNNNEIYTKNILLTIGLFFILILIILIITIKRTNKKIRILNTSINKRNVIINRYNTELEEIVEGRTKELNIAKLRAEESDLLKSKFLANISHEIRTPLNSIMGFSDLLCEPDVQLENVSRFSSIVRNKGFELLNIIDDIIDVSKIEAGLLKCKIENVKHSDIVFAVENDNFLKSKYFEKTEAIEFSTSFSETDLLIKANLFKLNIVFNKLINNAFQFTEKGFINVGSKIIDNQICFTVSDSGVGIPKERLLQVLEDFRKFKEDEHLKYPGLGVGLFIANNILLKMNSKLEIESFSGGGSIFSFKLDIVDA